MSTLDPTVIVLNSQPAIVVLASDPTQSIITNVGERQPVLVVGSEVTTVVFLSSRGAVGSSAAESAAVFIQGQPFADETLLRYNFTNDVQLSASASVATAGIPATASSLFKLYNGVSQIGTITFGINSDTGVIILTNPYFASHEVLTIVGPTNPDATLSDIAFTLVSS